MSAVGHLGQQKIQAYMVISAEIPFPEPAKKTNKDLMQLVSSFPLFLITSQFVFEVRPENHEELLLFCIYKFSTHDISFRDLSLGFILKILLKFHKFQPLYSYKIYSHGKKSVWPKA